MCDVEYRETAGENVLLHLSSVVSSGHPGGSETSTLPSLRTAEVCVCVCVCVYSSYFNTVSPLCRQWTTQQQDRYVA